MSDVPSPPWIHIGECPVCVNGLCRIRECEDERGDKHLYAVCDECESIWLEPAIDAKRRYAATQEPTCPICNRAMYGPQSHWARSEDLRSFPEWQNAAIFDMPSNSLDGTVDDLLAVDDKADDLDAIHLGFNEDTQCHDAGEVDNSYGQDEPKPGC